MSKKSDKDGLVYSTNPDFKFEENEETAFTETLPPNQQDLRIELDKRLKAGKKATRIFRFKGTLQDLELLCKHLKVKCSTGGAVKEGEILLQGDVRQRVSDELLKMGYKFKFSGG